MSGPGKPAAAAAGGGAAAAGAAKPQATVQQLLQRKSELEKELKGIEKQIFELEEAYIEDTSHYGNIIRGWDGYLAAKPGKPAATQRRNKISDKDRIFSRSSITAPEAKDFPDAAEGDAEDEDDISSVGSDRHRDKRSRRD